MDVWVAIIDACTQDATVIGVYTTEELALSMAKRVSPDEAADAVPFVLDEAPEWLAEVEREQLAAGRVQAGERRPPPEAPKQI
jgi:hypothetical protein